MLLFPENMEAGARSVEGCGGLGVGLNTLVCFLLLSAFDCSNVLLYDPVRGDAPCVARPHEGRGNGTTTEDNWKNLSTWTSVGLVMYKQKRSWSITLLKLIN